MATYIDFTEIVVTASNIGIVLTYYLYENVLQISTVQNINKNNVCEPTLCQYLRKQLQEM